MSCAHILKNTELREEMEERMLTCLENENNPKKDEVIVDQVVPKGGENKDNLDFKKN